MGTSPGCRQAPSASTSRALGGGGGGGGGGGMRRAPAPLLPARGAWQSWRGPGGLSGTSSGQTLRWGAQEGVRRKQQSGPRTLPPNLPRIGGPASIATAPDRCWSPASTQHLLFFFCPRHTACGILVPPPGIQPRPLQWERGILTTGRPENFPHRASSNPPSTQQLAGAFYLHI